MKTTVPPHGGITSDLLLALFEPPVSFHRCLVDITGGVGPALMLSHAIGTSQSDRACEDGWFLCTQEQWTEETGLSRWEQESARRALRCAGLLQERREGMPARLWFRVRPEAIWCALQAGSLDPPPARASRPGRPEWWEPGA